MSESNDPYASLGVPPEASFDAVQEARQARLDEVGDDPLARSRVEAAYDAVLMDRLKERQQGRVSTAARSASQREQQAPPAGRPALPALPQLPALPAMRASTASIALPGLALATGREFWFPLASIGSLLVLSLLPGADARLLLALASIATLLNLQRRLGRFPRAVLFTLLLLVTGLLLGGGLLALVAGQGLALPIGPLQLESLPALLLLLLGALLIA
ncbi:MAG: CPP1-like family protein [Cyanobium sp.]